MNLPGSLVGLDEIEACGSCRPGWQLPHVNKGGLPMGLRSRMKPAGWAGIDSGLRLCPHPCPLGQGRPAAIHPATPDVERRPTTHAIIKKGCLEVDESTSEERARWVLYADEITLALGRLENVELRQPKESEA